MLICLTHQINTIKTPCPKVDCGFVVSFSILMEFLLCHNMQRWSLQQSRLGTPSWKFGLLCSCTCIFTITSCSTFIYTCWSHLHIHLLTEAAAHTPTDQNSCTYTCWPKHRHIHLDILQPTYLHPFNQLHLTIPIKCPYVLSSKLL